MFTVVNDTSAVEVSFNYYHAGIYYQGPRQQSDKPMTKVLSTIKNKM